MKAKNDKPHLIGYVRVSTDEQDVRLQRDALLEYGVLPELIFEDKMTGATMDRPGLNLALKTCREGSVLVVWKFDRLGRTVRGVLETLEILANRKVAVSSITEEFNTGTPMGKLVMTILLSLAEMERNLISERTKAGLVAYKARGGRMGRKHFILSYPKRLKRFMELYADPAVDLADVSAEDMIKEMHKADRKAPPIKQPSSWYNWRKKDFIGLDAAIGIEGKDDE